ncbi:hypothetical protein MASR1M36_16000 [Candidatus Cloacimonadaceae bacterium]
MLRAVSRLRSLIRFMILLLIPVYGLAIQPVSSGKNIPDTLLNPFKLSRPESRGGSLPFCQASPSDQWTAYTNPYNFQSFLEDGEYLWFTSPFGVYRYNRDEGSSRLFNTATSGLNSNFVSDIAKDAQGNYWFSHLSFAMDNNLCGGISILHPDGSWDQINYEDVPFGSNTLSCLEFDSNGLLWVGYAMNGYSQGGLGCYNPQTGEWHHYDKNNSSLPSNTVMSMTKASDGSLWICFSGDVDPDPYVGGGLLHIDSDGWTVYNTQIADNNDVVLKDWYIKNVVEDSQGNLWFGLSGSVGYGLFKYDGTAFTRFSYADIYSYWDVQLDSQDRVYVNTISNGVMRFENGEWETLSDPDGFLADRYLQNLFMESNNRLWIALYDDLLVTWQNGVINPPALNPDIALKSMNSFHDLCAAPNGDMYFGTGWYVWGDLPRKTSLLKRSGEQWLSYGYDEYQNYVVNDICFDAQGSLYIATGDANSDAAELFAMYGSVCKLTPEGWFKYDNPNTGYPFIYASSVAVDAAGDIWAGTRTEGLAVFRQGVWTTYTTTNSPHIFSNTILDILAVPQRNLVWIATSAGLYKVNTLDPQDYVWTHYTPSNSSLPSLQVNCLAWDCYGRLWIGTNSGVATLDYDTWQLYPQLTGMYINGISVDELQGVWFASDSHGLIHYYEGSFSYFNRGNSPLPTHSIKAVASDGQGHLWVHPYNNGLYCFSYGGSESDDQLEPVVMGEVRNYPNPFNPSTTISFSLPSAGETGITIYNCRGQAVKSFGLNQLSQGSHKAVWNGLDDSGQPCASGVYLVAIKQGNKLFSHKITLLK